MALSIPASVPVRKTHNVETRSINAASFGACAIGCVMKSKAYRRLKTDPAKTIARIMPMLTIKRACNSSGVKRFLVILIFHFWEKVSSALAKRFALRRLALWFTPVLIFLAGISNPSLVSASAKAYDDRCC